MSTEFYTGKGNWCGDSVYISISSLDEIRTVIDLLEKFFANQKTWDEKFKSAAVKKLTPMVNDWKKTSDFYST